MTWVAGWQARECKGHGPLGVAVVESNVPPDQPAEIVVEMSFVGIGPGSDAYPVSRPNTPPDPPPKPC